MCFDLCLDVKESQSIFAYKRYTIKPSFRIFFPQSFNNDAFEIG